MAIKQWIREDCRPKPKPAEDKPKENKAKAAKKDDDK